MHNTLLAMGGLCTCLPGVSKDTIKSNCCFTPEIEQDSLIISKDKIAVNLKKAKTIQHPGYAALIMDNQKNINIILVHDIDGNFHCLERFCSHAGRALSFIKERNLLQCNNYNHSTFDLDGEVYNGPAPIALETYDVVVNNYLLKIKLK